MSLINRFEQSVQRLGLMRNEILAGLTGFCLLLLACNSAHSQNPVISRFRLEGKHSFTLKGADTWTVKRELIDEKSGISSTSGRWLKARGESATFNLAKLDGRDTVYHITARGVGIKQSYRVRVFKPDTISSFIYKSGPNPGVRTYIFVPNTLSSDTGIVVVMHGLSRNADKYILSWHRWAGTANYIIAAPDFDNQNWKGSYRYNLGNILTNKGQKIPRQKWSFQVVEDIQEQVRSGFGLIKDHFDIFGHSAGGQFVHRFMLFMPRAKVRLAIAANSGWYTLPDLTTEYPYGLKHQSLSVNKDDILNWSKRNVFILRGTDDIVREANLRQTPEADAQGSNRYERAGFMFEQIKTVNPATNWRLFDAPGVAHDQKRMAAAAQHYIDMMDTRDRPQ